MKASRPQAVVHPRSIILETMADLGWHATRLAEEMGYSHKHLSNVLNDKARVTPDFAIRYSRATGQSARAVLHAQADWDLRKALANA